jgi:predicted AlkP superfamily pyrophosphatase or phosphodiesterase
MRPISLRWLLVLFVAWSFSASAASFKTQHAVIVVMDGARYTETWGDPSRQYIPRIAQELAPQGVVLTQFKILPPGRTETNPGHATLTTGIYQSIQNNGKEFPKNPSLFQVFLKQTGRPATDAWVITSKDKLFVLGDCTDPDWKGRYLPSLHCGINGDGTGGYREDSVTLAEAKKALLTHAPALALINFRGPDSLGHANDWPGYLASIRAVDGYVADLWNAIQTHPTLRNTTTLILTNDHGRHDDQHGGFQNHGDDCEGCSHVLCVALGPDFKRGLISETPRQQTDVAATLAQLLGIKMPKIAGTPMTELLARP